MPEVNIEEIANGLHAGLRASKAYGQHIHALEKAGRQAFAIQLKPSTPRELVAKMADGLRAALEKRQYAVSRGIGGGKFSSGVLVTASPAERRLIISKIG